MNARSPPFAAERFKFYGTTVNGIPQQSDRWKRAVSNTSAALGDAVGKLYVKAYFPPEAKAKIQAMVKNIIAAFGRRIDNLSWMSPVKVRRIAIGGSRRMAVWDDLNREEKLKIYDSGISFQQEELPVLADLGPHAPWLATIAPVSAPTLNITLFGQALAVKSAIEHIHRAPHLP